MNSDVKLLNSENVCLIYVSYCQNFEQFKEKVKIARNDVQGVQTRFV